MTTLLGRVLFEGSSLDRAIAQLQILSEKRGDDRNGQTISIVHTLLNDLAGTNSGGWTGDRQLSTNPMAALSVTFEIVQ